MCPLFRAWLPPLSDLPIAGCDCNCDVRYLRTPTKNEFIAGRLREPVSRRLVLRQSKNLLDTLGLLIARLSEHILLQLFCFGLLYIMTFAAVSKLSGVQF